MNSVGIFRPFWPSVHCQLFFRFVHLPRSSIISHASDIRRHIFVSSISFPFSLDPRFYAYFSPGFPLNLHSIHDEFLVHDFLPFPHHIFLPYPHSGPNTFLTHFDPTQTPSRHIPITMMRIMMMMMQMMTMMIMMMSDFKRG